MRICGIGLETCTVCKKNNTICAYKKRMKTYFTFFKTGYPEAHSSRP